MATRYDVFLCHNGKDKPPVLELALKLREKGIESWLDKAELPGGVHWLSQAAQALGACRSCAFFVGPNGLGQWQEPELQIAMQRHVEEVKESREHPFPVIPVLLPGADESSLPKYLAGYTWVAFGQTLDDEEAIQRLACYIRGIAPGLGPGKLADENECPYRGLEFFDVAHAPYFFGREDLVARLVEKLGASGSKAPNRFLAVVGSSGSGKSSLARAGLVAALQRGAIEGSDQWPVVISRPGSDPCASLAVELARLGGLDLEKQAAFKDRLKDRMPQDRAALHESVELVLASDGSTRRLVVLIDQFEELFTICRDEKLRTAFVDNLVYASQVPRGRTLVLLAMRADFYGKCAGYADLARSLCESQELIGPMREDELRQAIEKPAQRVGCELEPGLIDLLLKEVQDEPGSLPFLQFALKELWNKRTGRRLTTEAYRAIGGVTGALQRKADEVYAGLSGAQQQICRRIFLRLTQPGEGTEDTKRRVPITELKPEAGSRAEVEAVLLDLSESETRLITGEAEGGEEFFEVAHEALIRGWPELRKWIDADRQALLTQRRLTEAANEWSKKDRDASFLYGGARLAAAREWATSNAEDLSPLESEFIKASRRHANLRRLQLVGALAVVLIVGTVGWLRIRAQNIEQNNATRAAGLVRQLLAAEISEVPAIVQELDTCRHWADPLLRKEDAQAKRDSSQKLHLDLALLPVDGTKVGDLRDRWSLVSPGEFVVVRDALLPYKDSVVEPLWTVALDLKRKDQQRFQAACGLATYAPNDKRWNQVDTFVVGRLVGLETSALVAWREALRPARAQLIEPLATIYRDPAQERLSRKYAAETLADYAADRPAELFDLLADSERFQFPLLFDKLGEHKDKAIPLAQAELARKTPVNATEGQKELLARRQANAAAALLRLGEPDQVWPLFNPSPDPRVRSDIIHWLSPQGADPQSLLARFTDLGQAQFGEPGRAARLQGASIRPALLLALGQFTQAQLTSAGLSSAGRQQLIEKLLAMYEADPGAGLHAATEWLLRKWGQTQRLEAAAETLKSDETRLHARNSTDKRQWYVNTQRQTFVIVDATGSRGEFLMGSPESDPDHFPNESEHRCRIGRRFAIAAHEVTKRQFDRFQQKLSERGNIPAKSAREHPAVPPITFSASATLFQHAFSQSRGSRRLAAAGFQKYGPRPNSSSHHQSYGTKRPSGSTKRPRSFRRRVEPDDTPQAELTWYEAAAYCNWLSEQEAIAKEQWCYEPNDAGKYAAGMKAKPNHLELTGYRLPTEAEWEFACRAGTVTKRYYGLNDRLLQNYAWHSTNGHDRAWPIGILEPNDFGVFDMLGNASEWCFDRYAEFPDEPGKVFEDAPTTGSVEKGDRRVLRGGNFDDQPRYVRSAVRDSYPPDFRDGGIGFRPARTYP